MKCFSFCSPAFAQACAAPDNPSASLHALLSHLLSQPHAADSLETETPSTFLTEPAQLDLVVILLAVHPAERAAQANPEAAAWEDLIALMAGGPRQGLEDVQMPFHEATASHLVYQSGPLSIDETAHVVTVHKKPLELTVKEYDLLRYLIVHQGELCTRDQLLDAVWGIDFETGTNTLDVYVHFVRKKLAAAGLRGVIETVRGVGFRLAAGAAHERAVGRERQPRFPFAEVVE